MYLSYRRLNISLEENKKIIYLAWGVYHLKKRQKIYIAYRYIEPGEVGSKYRLKKYI